MCGLGDCATQIKLKCDSCDGDFYAESSSGVTGGQSVASFCSSRSSPSPVCCTLLTA